IPRTAAMTIYGDLDVSVLDEMPPGRTPIKTFSVAGKDATAKMWAEVREAIAQGQQAFVVCPLIDESEKLEVASAEKTFATLGKAELKGLRLGLLHGRMSSSDKDATMGKFRDRELDVLVATTVIEVGVDVPNDRRRAWSCSTPIVLESRSCINCADESVAARSPRVAGS
ncbi:MAG: helicase-related protein, partial [Actinomycetota bacterium]